MEVDRKEKGMASSLEPTLTPEGLVKTNVTGGKFENRECREKGWKVENRTQNLEMPIFNVKDPDGWVFRVERYFTMSLLSD